MEMGYAHEDCMQGANKQNDNDSWPGHPVCATVAPTVWMTPDAGANARARTGEFSLQRNRVALPHAWSSVHRVIVWRMSVGCRRETGGKNRRLWSLACSREEEE